MLKIDRIDGFKYRGNNKRKKQIILTHTSRNVKDYISSLKYRYNGKNMKLPHYIIDREGNIFNIIPPNTYSEFFDNKKLNKNGIIITLENLGWLRKNPLTNGFINWIGNTYTNDIFEKKWRGYFFWQPYTDIQMERVSELVSNLCDEFNIPKNCIGHNVKVDKVENYNGVFTKSNYDKESTDLNPAFDFDIFINKIEHE